MILAQGDVLDIGPDQFGPTEALLTREPQAADDTSAGASDLATVELNHIRAALDKAGWVIDGPKGAAKILGLHPNTLRSRMKKMGLRREDHEIS